MRIDWPIFDYRDDSFSCWGLCNVWGHDYMRIPESPNGICLVCGNIAQDILSKVHKLVHDRQRQEEWVTRPCAICDKDVDWDRYADAHRTFDGELVCCHQHRYEYEMNWILSIKPDNGGTKEPLPFKWYWSWIQSVILKRDEHTCQNCGFKVNPPAYPEGLEVHHMIARMNGGSDHPSNLVTLCRKCHGKITGRQRAIHNYDLRFKNIPKLESYL